MNKNGTMICTRAHALMALSKLTGASPGSSDEAWYGWWEDYKKKNPGPRRLKEVISNASPN
jgi:hypothetical protein